MKSWSPLLIAFLTLIVLINKSPAAIVPLGSPLEIMNGVSIDFEGYPDETIANTLYQNQGITFTRDDIDPIFLSDWTSLGRTTTSPVNVLATIRVLPVNTTWATHLNIISTTPLHALGAYFGNDQGNSDFTTIRLSAYDFTGALLGSLEVNANGNTSVDQFIGLRSDIPFARVRFDTISAAGLQSQIYSVVVDDLIFAPVPEPSAICLSVAVWAAILVKLRANRIMQTPAAP
jgi:hypothetical protein